MPVLVVTMGDPGGVGPEVILKTFRKRKLSPGISYVILGSRAPFEFLKKKFRLPFSFPEVRDLKQAKPGKVSFLEVFKGGFDAGRVSKLNARGAFASMERAADEAAAGNAGAIVTAPLNKTSMRLLIPGFHGHTEYLAMKGKAKSFAMMFVGPRLKVTLCTIHVPLKKVSGLIKRGLVHEKIRLTAEFMKKNLGLKNPKIAVCALNPHGRETGTEDEKEIRPAVNMARKKGFSVEGPLSADQLFFDAYEGRFDAIVSMYHDQGLGPFKMIAFRDGVNVTLGLPFIRTSPDHGTAYDIAYKNQADPASFEASLALAEKLLFKTPTRSSTFKRGR